MSRSVTDIMREGQAKTLEQLPLLEKQMAGTITPEETVRLAMLTGNLMSLVKEAQAQGIGLEVQENTDEVLDNEDEELNSELFEDEDEGQSQYGFWR